MDLRGDSLVLTKPEAKALRAFAGAVDGEGQAGIVAQGSQLAAEDGYRAVTLDLADGSGWRGPAYLVPLEAWDAALGACPSRGALAVRLGELGVYRSAVDAELVAEADAAERSRTALATLEFVPTEAGDVDVSPGAGEPVPVWSVRAAHLAALALVARAGDVEALAVASSPRGSDGPLVVACGDFRCRFAGGGES